MSLTEIAAWWGAFVATLVLFWDIFKWNRTGAVVEITVSPNMKTFGDFGSLAVPEEDATYVLVVASNTGDRKTTLTHLIGIRYKTWYHRLVRKAEESFLVAQPALAEPFPSVLEPGENWQGAIHQNQEFEEMSRNGKLYVGVHHSTKKAPIMKRVTVKRAGA
jgi:hypothetical protein